MNTILVPIGSSENATNTLQYAIDFAKNYNANVFVSRAYKVMAKAEAIRNIDDIMERETNLYLNSIIRSVDTKNVDVKIITAKGSAVDTINSVDKKLGIDLIILGPKSNSIQEEVYLGDTSGSIIRKTSIPSLVVPEGYVFKPFEKILTAFKSGIIEKNDTLDPLISVLNKFNPSIELLLVKTPGYTEEDLVLDANLDEIKTSYAETENATTFQGVLANFGKYNPDVLCVFRRKRGFFKKLMTSNKILKEEFYCSVPLLILSGKQ